MPQSPLAWRAMEVRRFSSLARTELEDHLVKRIGWFRMDQTCIGQQSTLMGVSARTDSKPTAVNQMEYHWVQLWARMRRHYLSCRVYWDHEEFVAETDRARGFGSDADTTKNACPCPWIE